MTLTATQADLTRPPVHLVTTGLPILDTAGIVTGIVQRSTDGELTWKTVRGGIDLVIDGSGNIANLDDYEFAPGVVNTYRAGVEQEIVATFNATATNSFPAADTGQTFTLIGTAANFDAAGGFGTIAATSADTLYGAFMSGTWGDAEINWTFKYSASDITGSNVNNGIFLHTDGSLQNGYVVYNRINSDESQLLILTAYIGGVEAPSGLDSVALPAYTGADRRFKVRINGNRVRVRTWLVGDPEPSTWNIDTVVDANYRTMSGGMCPYVYRAPANTNTTWVLSIKDLTVDTGIPTFFAGLDDDITPSVAGFYLVSTLRSFLNTAPMVVGYDEPERRARGDRNYIAGRALPIAQGELASARSWGITFRTPSLASARKLEMLFASGDVLYFLTPDGCPIPSGYYMLSRVQPRRVLPRSDKRLHVAQFDECAAPGPDVVTAWQTWDSIIAAYGTWDNIVDLGLTWDDLLELVGDPSEVVAE